MIGLDIYIVFSLLCMIFYHKKRFMVVKNDDFYIFSEIGFWDYVRMLQFLNHRRLP